MSRWPTFKRGWFHDSALLILCAVNWLVTDEFPSQRPVTRRFDLCLNRRLSKQSWGWWFEMHPRSLWRHCNVRLYPTLLHDTKQNGHIVLYLFACCYGLSSTGLSYNRFDLPVQWQWIHTTVPVTMDQPWRIRLTHWPWEIWMEL